MSIKPCRLILSTICNQNPDLTEKTKVFKILIQKCLHTLLSFLIKESCCNFVSSVSSGKDPYSLGAIHNVSSMVIVHGRKEKGLNVPHPLGIPSSQFTQSIPHSNLMESKALSCRSLFSSLFFHSRAKDTMRSRRESQSPEGHRRESQEKLITALVKICTRRSGIRVDEAQSCLWVFGKASQKHEDWEKP